MISHLDFLIILIVYDVNCLLDIAEHKIAVAVIGLGKGLVNHSGEPGVCLEGQQKGGAACLHGDGP